MLDVGPEPITEGIYISMHVHKKNHFLLEVELFHLLVSMLCKFVIQSIYRISLKFLISSCNIIPLVILRAYSVFAIDTSVYVLAHVFSLLFWQFSCHLSLILLFNFCCTSLFYVVLVLF